jgi:hypothetical protein
MHYFLYPTKDTTITNHPQLLSKNMGLDEILEVEKTIVDPSCSGGRGAALSRALLQFDVSQISSSIASGNISNPQFFLALKIAESVQVPTAYNIVAYPLAQAWDMGTGYKYDGATVSNGASWKWSDSGSIKWYVGTDSGSDYSTDCSGGGIWYVSASLTGTGSGYAEAPYVSPTSYDPYPNCSNGISTGSRFTVVTGGGVIVNSLHTASLEAKITSGSTINFSINIETNTGPNPVPTSIYAGLYDNTVLVATASGDGIQYFPSGSYDVSSGSLPHSLKLVVTSSTTNYVMATLSIDGHLSGSSVLLNGYGTGPTSPTSSFGLLKSILSDVSLKGYSPNPCPVSGSHYLSISAEVVSTGSSVSRIGGTDIYVKYLGGSYVTSSLFQTSISGTDVTTLLRNPMGTWAVAGTTHQIVLTASGSTGTSGSYEVSILTDTPSTVTIPLVVASGSYAAVQGFNYQSSDVYLDVTNAVLGWIYGVIPNYGLILMHSGESNNVDYGKLRFFSKESNTIYQPHLDVMWTDAVSSPTASDGTALRMTDSSKPTVVSVNVNKEYKRGSIVRINVLARPKYPTKTFTNRASDYIEPMYLPLESYYAIKDAGTTETVMGFDAYTKLSSDAYGNYFTLDTTGLAQERYYTIDIMSEISGSVNTFSSPVIFKISR